MSGEYFSSDANSPAGQQGTTGQQLPAETEAGYKAAAAARLNAYVPYSGFKVGFALHSPSTGAFVCGANVENISYPAGICAERSAVVSAVSAGSKRDFDYGVLVTDANPPALPCGVCLQVLSEFCSPDFVLVACNLDGVRKRYTLGELLPHAFTDFPGAPAK